MQAIKDYENNKWKVIGQKVGKPAKVRILVPFSLFTLSSLCFCHGNYRVTSHHLAVPLALSICDTLGPPGFDLPRGWSV